MNRNKKTKEQLIKELAELRRKLKNLKIKCNHFEKVSQESEAKSRTLLEQIPLIIYNYPVNNPRLPSYVSPQVLKYTGFLPEEFNDEIWLKQIHPEDRSQAVENLDFEKKGDGPLIAEYRFITKEGRLVWFYEECELVRDKFGVPLCFQGVMIDITSSKMKEEELRSSQQQLRDLSKHLENVREEGRKRIAREIHDELGQSLTALKIDLSWLADKVSQGQQPIVDKIEAMKKMIDGTIENVHRISTKLRPDLLDVLGLGEAILWQMEEFQKRTGIKCEGNIDPENFVVSSDISTALFRIFQETLTNIARHASATKMKLNLKMENGLITMQVTDNGQGITKRAIDDPKSFGLIGMRERAGYFGGEFQINRNRGKGCIVKVTIPISGA